MQNINVSVALPSTYSSQDMDSLVYEFMVMFSLHSREMMAKLIDEYPQSAKELEKGLSSMRQMQKLLRKWLLNLP